MQKTLIREAPIAPRNPTPPLIANRYRFLFSRARGGFSEVIIAWDTRLARRVAIKQISTGISLPENSLEEARTAAFLSCPNIVSIYDTEVTEAGTLIIMENVDGPSLSELMSDSSELLDLNVITTILDGIVAALEFAHENQALHLDIKPANILIDQSGHIKVSDFGLAQLAGSSGFGEVQGGTVGYMPAEQLAGEYVDERTDLWALAILSYQLLTGQNPFFALNPRDSLALITAGCFALPSELRPELNGSIDEILIKALSPGSEERQHSVTEFWSELRPHLGNIGPGRKRLKTLTRKWAGKEAAFLEGGDDPSLETDAYEADEDVYGKTENSDETESPEQQKIAIWNSNNDDEDEDEEYWPDEPYRHDRRYQKYRTKARRKPGVPLWQRLTPWSQSFFSRCLSALAAASMAWLAMSALPYLSDPLAQAATTAAANTGNPAPALLDAAFTVRLALTILIAAVAMAVPRIGGVLAILCLGLGFFFTGNWLLGIVVLAGCIAWWIVIGRRESVNCTIFAFSPLLATLSLPLLLPLLAGYFQNWRQALGTAALGCFVCSLLTVVTYGFGDAFFGSILGVGAIPVYGQFTGLPLEDLLSASPTFMLMPDVNQLFMPLINLFTSLEFWLIFAGWLGASVVMSLLNGGQSRVKYVIATLMGTGIVAAGYLLPFFWLVPAGSMALLAAIIIRLVIALAICLLLIAFGVEPGYVVSKGKGRRR
ncbi:MAG: serine/threonine protein kinase [Coriobacteriales bacterium]|nr:serine/threonine protein kinase [Coriobacteriales bacterium]